MLADVCTQTLYTNRILLLIYWENMRFYVLQWFRIRSGNNVVKKKRMCIQVEC